MQKKTIYILLFTSLLANIIIGSQLYTMAKKYDKVKSRPPIQEDSYKMTEDIYFIGNSIIKDARLDSILGNRNIRNMAIPGLTSTDAVMMSNKLIPSNPKKVFVMLGVNDIKAKTPLNITIRNIGHFIFTIKRFSPNTSFHVLSVLPVNEKSKNYDIKNANIQALNKMIEGFCTRFKFKYIDLYDVLLDDESNLDAKYTKDGLHINDAAYHELGKHLRGYAQ